MVQKVQNKVKSRSKMVNTAFKLALSTYTCFEPVLLHDVSELY